MCANEVGYGMCLADIIVLKQNNYIHEIEIKTSKSDLCIAELRKKKHDENKNPHSRKPHYFSFAVPTDLIEDAKKIIEKLNPNYGLIEITNEFFGYNTYPVTTIKLPKLLHNDISQLDYWKEKISYRLCSDLIGHMKEAQKEINNEKTT